MPLQIGIGRKVLITSIVVIPIISLCFGAVSIATAFVHTQAQVSGVRFVLGMFEAGM